MLSTFKFGEACWIYMLFGICTWFGEAMKPTIAKELVFDALMMKV